MLRARFPLRWKIAAFAAALVALAVGALALFTVILPWREKLRAQEHLATALAKTVAAGIVDIRSDGVHWNANRLENLVANSTSEPSGLEVVYALLYDGKDVLNRSASTANPKLLERSSPEMAALYQRDRQSALGLMQKALPGVRKLPLRLKLPDEEPGRAKVQTDLGRLELGISTVRIDQELRASLLRDFVILLATLLVALLGAILMGGRIARPLGDLAGAMGRLQAGDFEQRSTFAHDNDEVGDLAQAFNAMADGLKERERLRGTLGRYVSGDVAERILQEKSDAALPGELRHVTVLFLDVRGFTTVAEQLEPAEVLELLNEYFSIVVDRVSARGGSVNKFIGDAAMCIWGAPRLVETPERDAVICALEMQAAAADLSKRRRARGLTAVGFGIGINCGEAVAGNLGTSVRLEYTVIGDAVNLAQRLESHARAGEILVSQEIYEKVQALVEAVSREPVKLKGKAQPVSLWEITRLSSAEAA